MRLLLLDTNAYTGLLAGDHRVLDALAKADAVLMSVFVLGELHAGFCGGSRPRENRDLLAAFLARPAVRRVPASTETAEIFGELKSQLQRFGIAHTDQRRLDRGSRAGDRGRPGHVRPPLRPGAGAAHLGAPQRMIITYTS